MPTSQTVSMERTSRQIITPNNVKELGITESILNNPLFLRNDQAGTQQKPIGIGINEMNLGAPIDPSAIRQGWVAYMNIGVPLIEERANIEPPPPETIAYNTYVNQDMTLERNFSGAINFTIENVVNWNVAGEARLTFQARAMEFGMESVAQKTSSTTQVRASYQQSSVDEIFTTEGTATTTAHAEADFLAQLQLAVIGSVGGALRISSQRTTTMSGNIPANSRIKVLTTQRRARRIFDYTIPVTFSGTVALMYSVPVYVYVGTPSPLPLPVPPYYQKIVPYDFSLLAWNGKNFLQKGMAEKVSSLEVEHTVFDKETLTQNLTPLVK